MAGVTYVVSDITKLKEVDAICHQVNCLTVKPHGLSEVTAKNFHGSTFIVKEHQCF